MNKLLSKKIKVKEKTMTVEEKEPTAEELLSQKKENGDPVWLEPKMSFRFKIEFKGIKIPDYLFRKFKLYNDGEKLIFETSLYETLSVSFSPIDFFKIFDIEVYFLDPTGEKVSSWQFSIETSGNYGENELLIHKFKFEVNKKTFKIN